MKIDFLTLDDVLDLHALQIEKYGGAEGVRDLGLLESAIAQPQATFDGEYVHDELFLMAAAYLFHIARNHPFMDGNKRTGLMAALVFLDLNGIVLDRSSDELYTLTMAVAEGRMSKQRVAKKLRQLVEK